MWSLHTRDTILCMLGMLEKISPSELLSNSYISNHNKVRRPRPKFKNSFYLYFCCFWINVTQINFENIKRKIQIIISDSCFYLKSQFNVDARAPSIPLLNIPFNEYELVKTCNGMASTSRVSLHLFLLRLFSVNWYFFQFISMYLFQFIQV